jgi:hypothetical protein
VLKLESSWIKVKILMNSAVQLPISPTATVDNKENLKLWLCELTHLSPQQVDYLMERMEQQAKLSTGAAK